MEANETNDTALEQVRPSMGSATPAEHCLLHVPEMLETILHELPTKDLLLSKAVCKTWKDLIDSSVKLQKALFLIADGNERFQRGQRVDIRGFKVTSDAAPNPLLHRFIDALKHGEICWDRAGKIVLDRAGSEQWKVMLLTQPPPAVVEVTIWTTMASTGLEYCSTNKVEVTDGVRVGDLLKGIEACKKNHEDRLRTEVEVDMCSFGAFGYWHDAVVEFVVR